MNRRLVALLFGPALVIALVVGVVVALNREPGGGATAPFPTAGAPTGDAGTDLVAVREAAGIAACPEVDAEATAREDGLPVIELQCLDGSSGITLSGLRGEPMIINLWATWCGPCREEAPHLAAYAEGLGADPPVQLLGIDIEDPDPAGAFRFAEASNWTWPQLADPEGRIRTLTGPAIPQTLFVDADGRIVHTHYGAFSSVEQLRATAEEQLGIDR